MARKRTFKQVNFSSFAWGGGPTSRIGVSFDRTRKEITPGLIDELFCGGRMECSLIFDASDGDVKGQKKFKGMDDGHRIEGFVCECKSVSLKPESIDLSLNYMVVDVDPRALAQFKKKAGTIIVKRTGDIEAEEEEVEEEDPDQLTLGGEEGDET